ncbi:MAG: phosphoglycerate dehydrogenase [Nitrospinaceae bacterium]|jgi:D-3-phosphoglycerate dehydrogenase / 2-oxoglutarate reductase|nr:phosphoglycerate dehydrogenase [Nitrospinaceae bacterium]MBT3432985.1 phosphoglycerate dehydrogenase [Nitrospinaceae bacterium]MBT3820128.1 phosphoglycerate dehydrogenase [Nitrospinaceae bacterium]MBT4431347.1 phosphoglycerate dehydrogenase [Nitrospinaceae bacterium]MBT5368302.1 phosphoglycerate dehydrogenase [Nitrospinaceae bacterium]
MAKGIAWITTTWILELRDPMPLLRPLEDEAGLEIKLNDTGIHMSEAQLLAELPGVVASLPSNDEFTAKVLSTAQDLKIISRTGVGLNSIDLAAAAENGIVVTSAVGQNSLSVAEHTFALLLSAARRINFQDQGIRAGEWASLRLPGAPLNGKTLGILGLGNIGKEVARRAAAFGMEIIACDIAPDERFAAEVGVYFHSLEEVASRADYLTCHVPLTPETTGIIGRELLALMKPGAFLINTSRGPVVDIDALAEALASGGLGGAGIDVFPKEPPEVDHPLFDQQNLIVTPHAAGVGQDACENTLRHAVRAVVDLLAGKKPHDIANPDVLKKLGPLS